MITVPAIWIPRRHIIRPAWKLPPFWRRHPLGLVNVAGHLRYKADGHLLHTTAGHLANDCGTPCITSYSGPTCPGFAFSYTLSLPTTILIDPSCTPSVSPCSPSDATAALDAGAVLPPYCSWDGRTVGALITPCAAGWQVYSGGGFANPNLGYTSSAINSPCLSYTANITLVDTVHFSGFVDLVYAKPITSVSDSPIGTYTLFRTNCSGAGVNVGVTADATITVSP